MNFRGIDNALDAKYAAEIARQDVEDQRRADEHSLSESVTFSPVRQPGEFSRIGDFVTFWEAGNATFTIQSRKTGKRFTFRVSRSKKSADENRPIWVSVLSGSDNNGDYSFIGTIWNRNDGYAFNRGSKSRATESAPSVLAIKWICDELNSPNPEHLFEKATLWHEGRCGRCGRKLTVPESIASGIGPECASRMGC